MQNPKTRDYLRGLLARTGDLNPKPAFANLMNSVSASDLTTVDELVRTNGLFSHLELTDEFPLEDPPFLGAPGLFMMPRDTLRAQFIALRANQSADSLANALEAVRVLNRALLMADDDATLALTVSFIAIYGHSLLLARKLAFILGHFEKETESWKLASKIFANYGVNARNYGIMAVADSIGFEFNYLDLKAGFEEFGDCGARSSASQKLSYLSFYPITLDVNKAFEGVAANYSFSLIDAVHYVLCHRDLDVLPNIEFDPRIEQTWADLQSAEYPVDLFFGQDKAHADLRAFRASASFLESAPFREFRAANQYLYQSPDSRSKTITPSNPFEARFFASVSTIRDLLPGTAANFAPLPTVFRRESAGSLARSCGLTRVAESDPDFSGLDRYEMAALMGRTIDIDRLLSVPSLRAAAKTATDEFVVLILHTLIRAHSPATKDSYRFKQTFQQYVSAHHAGDIVAFIKAIHSMSPDIVEYYVGLLDETLLSQLPFLVGTAEQVYETRAQILEWYSSETGEAVWSSKAKQLRIDRKIAAVREQINDTRLNIDALRFRQWIESSKLGEFSGFIRQEAVDLPSVGDISNRKARSELRLVAHRDPSARAMVAIMDCYKEFCTNADFGVASYLGRRIRHGTLRGTLLDGLPDPDDFDLGPAARSQYERWLERFRASIQIITGRLHFAGKSIPGGGAIISPEVDTKEKWDVLTVCLHSVHEKSQLDQGALAIPLTIEQYCWYILELELKHVQDSILQSRNDFGVFRIRANAGDGDALGFERAVNIGLADRFTLVASWLKKPPNISPVAEIGDIIEVVLKETRAEYPSFTPNVDQSGTDLELSGGVYYHVYDALSVVIKNAGKHGHWPGTLLITAASENRETGSALRLDITSHVALNDSAVKAVQRMEEAGSAGPLNADVVEGLSGVRKLQKMKVDKAILDFEVQPVGRTHVVASVWFPLSGLVS